MGSKLLWLGFTLIIAVTELLKFFAITLVPPVTIAGAIIMIIGLVLFLFNN